MTTLTDYLLETKADWPDPATEPDPAEGPELDAEPQEWAGDLYDAGDETDPAEAFAVFTGAAGLEGWLDRADDGTLTGWVRDPAGGVYRYSDVDAWAIDVRDSGMSRTDPGMGVEDPNAELEGEDDAATEDPSELEGEDDADPFAEGDDEGDELAVDDDAADEVGADTDDPDPDTDDLADDMDPDEDDDEDDFTSKFKRKGVEGKSYELVFEPWVGR